MPAALPTGEWKITYLDGEVATTKIRPVHIIAAERKWPDRSPDRSDAFPAFEGMHFVVWVAAGKPDGDFDKWMARVDEVEVVEVDSPTPLRPAVGDA